jgi:hypothetical protein
LVLPVCERAELIASGKVAAQWLEPQKWPEILMLETELAKAEGRKPHPLGPHHADAATRQAVELYALGFMPGTLREVMRKLPSEPFWRQPGKRRDLADVSMVVVRKTLNGESDTGAADLLARADAELAKASRNKPDAAPTSIGSLLAKVVGGTS